MNVKKLAGAALIILAVANVVYAFVISSGPNRPGYFFALVNSLLLTFGVLLLFRSHSNREPKAKGPSIVED